MAYAMPSYASYLLRAIGLLPVDLHVVSDEETRINLKIISYGILLGVSYLIGILYCVISEVMILIKKDDKVFFISRQLFKIPIIYCIVTATNIQHYRLHFHKLWNNLKRFDELYDGITKGGPRQSIGWLYRVTLVTLLLAHFLSRNQVFKWWHAANNTIWLIYACSSFELFIVDVLNVQARYRRLNDSLIERYWNKPIVLKFLQDESTFIYNTKPSAMTQTRTLHKILTDTVEQINTQHGWQLLFGFLSIVIETASLPTIVHSYKGYSSGNVSLLFIANVVGCIFINYQMSAVLYYAFTTNFEANRTSRIVISLLNRHSLRGSHKELLHHSHEFTVLGLFKLHPANLLSVLSLISFYSATIVQLNN